MARVGSHRMHRSHCRPCRDRTIAVEKHSKLPGGSTGHGCSQMGEHKPASNQNSTCRTVIFAQCKQMQLFSCRAIYFRQSFFTTEATCLRCNSAMMPTEATCLRGTTEATCLKFSEACMSQLTLRYKGTWYKWSCVTHLGCLINMHSVPGPYLALSMAWQICKQLCILIIYIYIGEPLPYAKGAALLRRPPQAIGPAQPTCASCPP